MPGRATVLLVEDNEDNRRIYADILCFGGYDVLEAEDGITTVERAREHLPDLIPATPPFWWKQTFPR